MTIKHSYLIESLAPLVFRSGKPFGSQASAQDVIFPLPSAAAGLVRALGIGQNQLEFTETRLTDVQNEAYQNVLSVAVKGPFLVRYDQQKKFDILVTKPANALYFENKETGETELVRLVPQAFDENIGSDLPSGLLPVQMQTQRKGKPKTGVSYWTLEHLLAWQQGKALSFVEVQQKGLTQLPIEIRTHVAIDSETQANIAGKLFQTASLDLGHRTKEQGGWSDERYGFVVQSELALKNDLATFGGERRLSRFEEINLNALQTISEKLVDEINQAKGLSLNFLSPAIFAQGYLPQWIDENSLEGTLPIAQKSIRVKLKAVAIDRWLPVSGWDSLLWKPKAMRKAVGSGSMYWFELLDEMDLSSLQALSTYSFSDHEQDQRDGFGVALISAWSYQA